MDFISHLPESNGYDAIYVIIDKLTKFAIFEATTTTLTEVEAAKLFFKLVISPFGLPKKVIADRDIRWKEVFWKEISEVMGMKRSLATAYHPQADGQTEITNMTLEVALRAYIDADRSNWAELLPQFSMSYNTTVHTATNSSPAYLLYGFEPNTPATFLQPQPNAPTRSDLLKDDSINFIEALEAARQKAKDALVLAQNAYQNAYNSGRLNIEFEVGQRVLIDPHSLRLGGSWGGTGVKLSERYEGPFEIIEKYGPVTYKLRLPVDYNIHPVINIAHLELYRDSPPKFNQRRVRDIKRRYGTSYEDWEVIEILEEKTKASLVYRNGVRKTVRTKLYRCKWRYPDGSEQETGEWVPERNFANAPGVISAWKVKRRKIRT
jgi:hypothetical protein